MYQIFNFMLACVFVASAYGTKCTTPKVDVTSFSTQDATILTQLAHIGELTFKCGNGAITALFAAFPCGKIVPVAKIGEQKFQVSWTEDIKKGSSGNVVIRLFGEDGYSALRKVQRDGGKLSTVESLVDVTINTKSAYKGPWVKTEIVAAFLVAVIAYYAVTTKSKVQA